MPPPRLALEYQGKLRAPRRNLDVTDLVNNPGANGLCGVHGMSLLEEGPDLTLVQLRAAAPTDGPGA